MLLDYLLRKRPPGPLRHAILETFFAIRDRERGAWRRQLDGLEEELRDLRGRIKEQQRSADGEQKKWTEDERNRGLDKDARRAWVRLEGMKSDERAYGEYAAAMTRLLALDPADFDPGKFKIEELIPRKSLGEANSIGGRRGDRRRWRAGCGTEFPVGGLFQRAGVDCGTEQCAEIGGAQTR